MMNSYWSLVAHRSVQRRRATTRTGELKERVIPPPQPARPMAQLAAPDDWTGLPAPSSTRTQSAPTKASNSSEDAANGGIRREPELPEHEDIAPEPEKPSEFAFADEEPDDDAQRARVMRRQAAGVARRPQWIRATALTCDAAAMRTKHTFRLPPELAVRLAEYADRKRVPQALVVETALNSYLSPDNSERMEAALGRRLDRLTRQVERLERHITISNEALALFVRFWLTATPPLPDAAQSAAQAKGRERYEGLRRGSRSAHCEGTEPLSRNLRGSSTFARKR